MEERIVCVMLPAVPACGQPLPPITPEQGYSLSGPLEIALTICLSLGDRVMLGRGCGALTLVCLCWHERSPSATQMAA